jgi:hypothetical protein
VKLILEVLGFKLAPFGRALQKLFTAETQRHREEERAFLCASAPLRLCVSAVKNGNSYTIKF